MSLHRFIFFVAVFRVPLPVLIPHGGSHPHSLRVPFRPFCVVCVHSSLRRSDARSRAGRAALASPATAPPPRCPVSVLCRPLGHFCSRLGSFPLASSHTSPLGCECIFLGAYLSFALGSCCVTRKPSHPLAFSQVGWAGPWSRENYSL